MPANDLQLSTTTDMNSLVKNFTVQPQSIQEGDYYYWTNPLFTRNLGYYKTIPELKKAIDALATWTVGKGWTADANTTVELEHISGWGEDTFDSIMWNMLVMKKINGDAFAEIIRDEDTQTIINIKPINPERIRIKVNSKGLIESYEEIGVRGQKIREYQPKDILHLSNDRVASEIHGISVIDACKWVIDARNEAMADKRRILHRNSIRVITVDANDTQTYTQVTTQWATAIKNGEVAVLPKDSVEFPDVPALSTAEHSEWIRYLESFYYKAVGVPEIIMGGSAEFTEANSKVGYLTFEVPYNWEAIQLEKDIWNQLQLRVTFNRPASLMDNVQTDEQANTGQVGFQANDVTAGSGK